MFSFNALLSVQSLVTKRSPLELGYATFPDQISHNKNVAILMKKLSDDDDLEKSGAELRISPSSISKTHRSAQEWVPGHIRHHSFIPAHIQHIYVPLLLAKDIQAVLVKPPENLYFYPRHFGGYGVGSDIGGQGAGHGFQIIFNP